MCVCVCVCVLNFLSAHTLSVLCLIMSVNVCVLGGVCASVCIVLCYVVLCLVEGEAGTRFDIFPLLTAKISKSCSSSLM